MIYNRPFHPLHHATWVSDAVLPPLYCSIFFPPNTPPPYPLQKSRAYPPCILVPYRITVFFLLPHFPPPPKLDLVSFFTSHIKKIPYPLPPPPSPIPIPPPPPQVPYVPLTPATVPPPPPVYSLVPLPPKYRVTQKYGFLPFPRLPYSVI